MERQSSVDTGNPVEILNRAWNHLWLDSEDTRELGLEVIEMHGAMRRVKTESLHYKASEALERIAANTYMAEQAIEHGYHNLAACYASTAAHFGLMLIEQGTVRCHIDSAISQNEMVL